VRIERTSAAVRFRLSVCLDHQRDATRTVALVENFLELRFVAASGRPFDRPLDVVGGHVDRRPARLLDGQPEPIVRVGIATTLARRDHDLAGHLGEQRPASCVVGALLALDRRPLGVTGHRPGV
jgi:hypothetical protein